MDYRECWGGCLSKNPLPPVWGGCYTLVLKNTEARYKGKYSPKWSLGLNVL